MELNRFKQLLESKSGDVKPLISEQLTGTTGPTNSIFDECFIKQSIPLDTLPNSCQDLRKNPGQSEVLNLGPCISELMKGEFYNTEDKMNRVDAALDCVFKILIP